MSTPRFINFDFNFQRQEEGTQTEMTVQKHKETNTDSSTTIDNTENELPPNYCQIGEYIVEVRQDGTSRSK